MNTITSTTFAEANKAYLRHHHGLLYANRYAASMLAFYSAKITVLLLQEMWCL